MVRVRVYYPDGVFRGGFLTIEHLSRVEHRIWDGPPHPHYSEVLIHDEGDCWYLLQTSKSPQYDRPEDDLDAFDADSKAFRYSDEDALRWFEAHKINPPMDVLSRAGRAEHAAGTSATSADATAEKSGSSSSRSRREKRHVWLAKALLLVKDEPWLSNAEIARRIEISPSTLSRSREFQAAAGLARGANRSSYRSGYILDDGDVEAVVDPEE